MDATRLSPPRDFGFRGAAVTFEPLQRKPHRRRRRQRGKMSNHKRSKSLNHGLTPEALSMICNGPLDLDLLVEKSSKNLETHERDFDALIHATEQLVTAQRLKDLAHKVMIETLRSLRCSSMIKKKSNELADLLYNMYLQEIERTDVFNNLLDVLENVKNTHRVTAGALQDEYEKAQKKLVDFSEKHPELDLSSTSSPVSSCSSDEHLEMSDNLNLGNLSLDDLSLAGNVGVHHSRSHSSSTFSTSIFSFLRSSSAHKKLLEQGERLKENLGTRRNDFVNSVNILEKKSSDLVLVELNELCNLYRGEVCNEEPADPVQPL